MRGLVIIAGLVLSGLVTNAQLSMEYTTSVYEEVKHPFPLFDELGVVSMEKFLYKNNTNKYEYYYLFEKLANDSVLIYSCVFDSSQNKYIEKTEMLFDQDHTNEYYLSKDKELMKTVFWEENGQPTGIHLKHTAKKYYSIKYYERDSLRNIICSRLIFYNESWKQLRKNGKRFSFKKDSSSFILSYYNTKGYLDSSYSFKVIKRNKHADTLAVSKKVVYNEKWQVESIIEVEKNVLWYQTAAYGLFWRFRSKYQPYRASFRVYKVAQHLRYDSLENLTKRDCIQDDINACSEISEYNSSGKLERTMIFCDDMETIVRKYTYDSLDRVHSLYRNSKEWGCYRIYPNYNYKLVISEPWQMTINYIYNSDSTYTTYTSHTLWYKNDTSYYNASNQLIKQCGGYGTCRNFNYNSQGKIISVINGKNNFLERYGYNKDGLLTEQKIRYDTDEDFEVTKVFYK